MTAERLPRPRGYAKPVVVPDRLDLLAGPTSGVVTLPRHLKWSGSPRYDLDQPGRIADMYRTVLNEAAAPVCCSEIPDIPVRSPRNSSCPPTGEHTHP